MRVVRFLSAFLGLASTIALLTSSHSRADAQTRQPRTTAAPADPCAAPANKIVSENCKPGNPREEWDVYGSGDPNIQGFATDMSVNLGETVAFKIKTHSPRYRIDVYRLGWYAGNGARRVQTIRPSVPLPQSQPECWVHPQTRLTDCGTWRVSASWPVPRDAVSGVYAARLVREDDDPVSWQSEEVDQPPRQKPAPEPQAYGALGQGQLRDALKEKRASHVIFVVRDDAGKSDLLFQTSDPTWVAFNPYGGSSLYGSWPAAALVGSGRVIPTDLPTRAFMASYNRPLTTRAAFAQDQFFNAEYPLVRWLERNGYDVSYFAGVDTDRRGERLLDHKVFVSAGHDAYWSGSQRRSIEAARDGGVNLAFFGGGAGLWRTRWESSNDGSNAPHRTLVSYKETHGEGKLDSVKDEWTGTWRDSSVYNPLGPKPENAVTGTLHAVGGFRNDPLMVPAEFARHRFWRNTDVATKKEGTALLGKGVLGPEWDEDIDNGARPAGLVYLSATTLDNVAYLQDLGTLYDSGTATHHLTLYRAPGGALVFSAGTPQYSWGLENSHTNWTAGGVRVRAEAAPPPKALQQATINLLADMRVQPASLQRDLVPAEASSDKTSPNSVIDLERNTLLAVGPFTIRGTATDPGGGIVAAVELSIDGGTTWHPAVGTTSWSYTFDVPPDLQQATIVSRAVDDSANVEVPRGSVPVRGPRAVTP
jgi:N,N-dimethylformamidase beta subunit-like, C-terminal